MENSQIEVLKEKYFLIIDDLIKVNKRFYKFNYEIKWIFIFDEKVENVCAFDAKKGIIKVNVAAVAYSYENNQPLLIECFLLHEIRHLYQQLIINEYLRNPKECTNSFIAQRWFFEKNNYIKPLDENGQLNVNYYLQEIELDAFSFSYAVIIYKYGDLKYLKIPSAYQNEYFKKHLDAWVELLKKEQL